MSSASSLVVQNVAPFETPAHQTFRLRRGGPGILKKRPRPTDTDDDDADTVNPAVEPGVRAKRCRAMLRKNSERLHELCMRMYRTMAEAQKLKDESHACADFARLLALSNESHQMTQFDWSELQAHHADLEQIFEVVMLPDWVVLWPLDEPYSPVKVPVITRNAAVPAAVPERSGDTTTDEEAEEPQQSGRELTRSSSPSY